MAMWGSVSLGNVRFDGQPVEMGDVTVEIIQNSWEEYEVIATSQVGVKTHTVKALLDMNFTVIEGTVVGTTGTVVSNQSLLYMDAGLDYDNLQILNLSTADGPFVSAQPLILQNIMATIEHDIYGLSDIYLEGEYVSPNLGSTIKSQGDIVLKNIAIDSQTVQAADTIEIRDDVTMQYDWICDTLIIKGTGVQMRSCNITANKVIIESGASVGADSPTINCDTLVVESGASLGNMVLNNVSTANGSATLAGATVSGSGSSPYAYNISSNGSGVTPSVTESYGRYMPTWANIDSSTPVGTISNEMATGWWWGGSALDVGYYTVDSDYIQSFGGWLSSNASDTNPMVIIVEDGQTLSINSYIYQEGVYFLLQGNARLELSNGGLTCVYAEDSPYQAAFNSSVAQILAEEKAILSDGGNTNYSTVRTKLCALMDEYSNRLASVRLGTSQVTGSIVVPIIDTTGTVSICLTQGVDTEVGGGDLVVGGTTTEDSITVDLGLSHYWE